MDKIWIVENSSGKNVFYTEDRFNNYISNGNLSDSRIRIYDLSSDMSSREYKEEMKREFKQKMREIRLSTLLDSDRSPEEIGEYETMKSMVKLADTISEYSKSLSEKGGTNYNYIRNLSTILNNTLDMRDIKLFKKKIIDNKVVIMYDILNSIEDYKNVLKIHNFRSLPNIQKGLIQQKGWKRRMRVAGNYGSFYYNVEEMDEKYPKQHEMFEIAKEELKNK